MIVYRLTSLCPGALQLGTVLVSPIPCCQGSVALPFVYWVVVGGSASSSFRVWVSLGMAVSDSASGTCVSLAHAGHRPRKED